MKKVLIIGLLFCPSFLSLYAQNSYASWTATELTLTNGVVKRVVQLPAVKGNFVTTSYKPVAGEFKYFTKNSVEFALEVNDINYSGESGWTLIEIKKITDINQGDGAAVTLQSQDKKIEVTVHYLLYPACPVVRKSLSIKNLTHDAIRVESIDVERLDVSGYWSTTFSWIFSDYGRRRSIGPFQGGMQDALTILHQMDWKQGIVIGNEAPGVLKRTSIFWETQEIAIGLTHKDARYPFRKWIKPEASYVTPQVFTMVYNTHLNPEEMLNSAVPDFVRKHMGIRLSQLKDKPTFVYNTWIPFKDNINEKLIMELAQAAANAGMKEFVIDDGWQDNYGDWNIDKTKFPNGLKPVFDYIKSLGMKPGLWVSVGSASSKSKVYHEHPEWFVKGKNGNFANLQNEGEQLEVRSACFSTGWKDYMKNILTTLISDYGLEYLKLDFAVVSSAYVFDHEISGCYAMDHPAHTDHHESMIINYDRMWALFDELHAIQPSLFIDCTFEAMGGLQLIDYAMLQHAEGNWLSNFMEPNSGTDLRVRNMAWWRSPAMTATALVIGNPVMDDKGWEMHIKSLAGALPIMLGDPRKLSTPNLKAYQAYADWLQLMQKKYDMLSYRQDLPGFGEPADGYWDGFQRINTELKSGGIIGVFRHGALEKKRVVTVNYLDENKIYIVNKINGEQVIEMSGLLLKTKGFNVELPIVYSGELFEVHLK